MTTAKNAPCPCGSGHKYKKCCYVGSRIYNGSMAAAYPVKPHKQVSVSLLEVLIAVVGLRKR